MEFHALIRTSGWVENSFIINLKKKVVGMLIKTEPPGACTVNFLFFNIYSQNEPIHHNIVIVSFHQFKKMLNNNLYS